MVTGRTTNNGGDASTRNGGDQVRISQEAQEAQEAMTLKNGG